MAQSNRKLAALFQQTADVLEILGANRFRINAYVRAARVIDELAEPVADLTESELQQLPGVGKGMAQRIGEYLDTGAVEEHQQLLNEIPTRLPALLEIPGLGPKKVALLWKQAGVESLDDLKQKLEGDQLAQLPGMGAKSIVNLRKNLAFVKKSAGRMHLGRAMPLAKWFVEQLSKIKGVKQAGYAGSLRRGRETIGDIDLLAAVAAKDAQAVSQAFVELPIVGEVLAQGQTKTAIRTNADAGEVQVDLRLIDPANFGAALLYFTGSKEHNIQLRERAIKQGATLNEYALTDVKTSDALAGRTEQDIYQALGLTWIAPELREARDEIALSQEDKLPELIELADIRAELHTHTTASDGHWSIEQLALAAAQRGFHTVAVTDHSKGQAQANGLNEKRLIEHIENIRTIAKKLKGEITLLAGSEVDILADGRLDYPDELLAQLDIVVASPHAALSQEPDKATRRLLKAIENPYVTIIGHPTGRLINRREGLSPDIKALVRAVGERGIALEINANHWRLDLRDSHARAAIEAGVKLAINTDAHGPGDLDQLIFGVLTARRAGATKHNVVNGMSKTALRKWLYATRQ